MLDARRRTAKLAITLITASLALTGCSGSGTESTTISQSVQVSDNYGEAPRVTIGDTSGLGTEIEREIPHEGTGEVFTENDIIVGSSVIYDATDGRELVAYAPLSQPFTLTSQGIPPVFREAFQGIRSGSRVAALIPGSKIDDSNQSTHAVLFVADVERLEHTAAWGAPQAPTQTQVTVTDGADGALGTVMVDSSSPAPTDLVLDTIKRGDGKVVTDGSSVVVQYRGLLYDTGEIFDESWARDLPAQFATNQVVPGFSRALIDQTVGSRVIAIIPPELGYGEQGSGDSIPPNSTLVFVIDILGVL